MITQSTNNLNCLIFNIILIIHQIVEPQKPEGAEIEDF